MVQIYIVATSCVLPIGRKYLRRLSLFSAFSSSTRNPPRRTLAGGRLQGPADVVPERSGRSDGASGKVAPPLRPLLFLSEAAGEMAPKRDRKSTRLNSSHPR